jgi:hypothetical protein
MYKVNSTNDHLSTPPTTQRTTESQIPVNAKGTPTTTETEKKSPETIQIIYNPITTPCSNKASNLLAVGGEGTSEAALAEVVLDRTLLGSS